MTTNAPITLRHGPLELRLAPHIGGSILSFEHIGPDGRRMPVLRTAATDVTGPLDAACFPLVPYVNRIRGGRFRFRERDIALTPNMAGDASPLHGQGWLAPWHIERQLEAECELSFRHEAGEWPWAYEARQHLVLDELGLQLRLTCRNISGEAMPCGLGQHPYFPCGPDTVLDTSVEDVWTVDEAVLPVERRPADERYDLNQRPICGQELDNGYSGWAGEAWIRDAALPFAIRLTSPQARFFQVYSPREGGFFAAEPVTHANAALNSAEEEWPDLGLRVLEPGEEMALDSRLDVIVDQQDS